MRQLLERKEMTSMLSVLICILVAVSYMALPNTSHAVTGLTTTNNLDDLAPIYVNIDQLDINAAKFTSTNTDVSLKKWEHVHGLTQKTFENALVYRGKLKNWGTQQVSSKSNAKVKDNKIDGEFTFTWENAAHLKEDPTKNPTVDADVQITLHDIVISVASSDKEIRAQEYDWLLAGGAGNFGFYTANPRTNSEKNKTAKEANVCNTIGFTIKILEHGTNNVISEDKYPTTRFGFNDIDQPDRTIATGNDDPTRYAGLYAESVALGDGILGPVYLEKGTYLIGDKKGGAQRYRGSQPDGSSMMSGFATGVKPQGFSYVWRGSVNPGSYKDTSSTGGHYAGAAMGTKIVPYEKLFDMVDVTYTWVGDHPDIDPPAGQEDIIKGSEYEVDDKFTDGYIYVDDFGDKWTFHGWKDAPSNGKPLSGKIIINERTIIYGSWTRESSGGGGGGGSTRLYVPVTYVWVGEHPDIDPPAGANVRYGVYHEVDESFPGMVITEGTTKWTCLGWDQSGDIAITEPTVIHGRWVKDTEVSVIYVWDGEHPNIDPPASETVAVGTAHRVDTSFPGKVVDENGVTWTCEGWDKSDVLIINETTIIRGTWKKELQPVPVSYVWDGEHPDIAPPTGKTVDPGDQYIVDTDFPGKVIKDGDTTWVCNGWDKSGTIVINEPTVIHGTWTKTKEVPVIYVWDGEHPSIDPPEGETVEAGTQHAVDAKFPGMVVTEGNVKWTCEGWDKSGTITINEPTVIHGTWKKIIDVPVIYVWDGEHPDIDPPADELVEAGTKHTVDTTFPGKVVTEDGVKWTCEGWDQKGEITINEPTIIHGTWKKEEPVPVKYVWDGEHPNIDPPAGETVPVGTQHDVDTVFPGKVVKEGNTTWTCTGWDKSGTIVINEPTVIHGTWKKTTDVPVIYVWDGEHPDIDPPAEELVEAGTKHTVDTTFPGKVVTEDGVKWTCEGWDQSGTITINEPTIIHGTWKKEEPVTVKYVWDGEHPNIDPPDGKKVPVGTQYDVDTVFPGKVVKEGNVTWTCTGWDQSGTITINEPTVIHGTWTKTVDVPVIYVWDGEHPDIDPPADELVKTGTKHTVDTTFPGKVVTEDGIKWACEGWDKSGTITINEPTIIHGTWKKEVTVRYEWKGEHPDIDPPAGEAVAPGTKHTVDTTFPEKEVVDKDGVKWTCEGWDQSGTITINEPTVIYGTWKKEPPVPVSYEWKGEHPDIDPPEGETVAVGTKHTVDTTFPKKEVVDKDDVKWTCEGWDQEGEITINEPTVIHGTWKKEAPVTVKYVWDGEHPNIDPPAGETVPVGTQHDVDTVFPGKVVKEGNVTWTCTGWDKSGTITINEPTVIYGTWKKTTDVPVIYVWDGEHPDVDPPADELVKEGTKHTVDTTFPGKVVTEDGVKWTCEGWDQEGEITINEPTIIHGTWKKEEPVTVKYVWDGEHPDIDPPKGEKLEAGAQHDVDTTFPGKVVKEGNVTWTCTGWDQSGTITINEPTVIHGTWTKTVDVPVIYVWDGEHPDIDPPADELVKTGTKHTVDTTFPGKVVTEDGIKWTCNDWDKSGEITINEPTIIHGTWKKEVPVKYEWEGEHPDIDPPAGETVEAGKKHTVDTTFPGKEVVDKDGVKWICEGWDQVGDITINEPTVIHGTWKKAEPVTVKYVWEGEHPDIDPPKGETVITGTKHTVDTSFPGKVIEEGNVTWTCNGWDQSGEITINEPTVIHGTWQKVEKYDITTEVVNGKITEDQKDIPKGENRTITYEQEEGYTLVSITVDGEEKDPKEFPASYPFEDIQENHHIKVVFEKIPKLAIEKTADKEVYNAGDTVTYTVTVRQTVEGMEARNVSVKDTMPEGVTLNKESFTGEGFTVVDAQDHSYELSIPSLKTELTYTYTAVTAKDADAEELINIVTATAENVPGDPAKDEAKIKSKLPKPTITKQVSNETPVYGEEITYTISVKEPQDGIVLRNAVVTDQIPEGIEYVADSVQTAGDASTASFENGKLVVNIPQLATETVVSFKAKVTKTSGTVDNVAVLTGDGIKEIQDNAKITVKAPQPVITKTVSNEKPAYGEVITYTITAKEPQEGVVVTNAVVTDQIPEGIEYVADSVRTTGDKATASFENGKLVVKIPQLATETVITFKAKVTKMSGSVKNVAVLSGDDIKDIQDTALITVKDPQPRLTKTVSPKNCKKGDTVTYTLKAYSDVPLISGKIVDTLPDSVIIDESSVEISDDSMEYTVEDNVLTVKYEKLQGTVTIKYEAEATKTGTFTNVAKLTAENFPKGPIKATAEIKVTKVKKPAKNTPSTKTSKKKSTGSARTGDDMNIWIWLAMMAAAVLAGGAVFVSCRRHDRR